VLEKFFIVGEDVECRVLVRTYKVGQKIEVTIPTKVAVLRAEVINDNIYNGVDEAVEKLVNERLKGSTPKSSTSKGNSITKEQFSKMGLAERQKLYTENRELYNKLSQR
jgi:putative sigma-54 modulation protein